MVTVPVQISGKGRCEDDVMSGNTTPVTTPTLHTSNVFGSPGSTWAGTASILAVVSSAMATGLPTNNAGWITFAVSLLTGIGAIFSKA